MLINVKGTMVVKDLLHIPFSEPKSLAEIHPF